MYPGAAFIHKLVSTETSVWSVVLLKFHVKQAINAQINTQSITNSKINIHGCNSKITLVFLVLTARGVLGLVVGVGVPENALVGENNQSYSNIANLR